MTFINPRTGDEIVLENGGTPGIVFVTNDLDDLSAPAPDTLAFDQQVIWPGDAAEGFLGVIFGSETALDDTTLPDTIDLDDWPLANILYLAGDDDFGEFILAQVTSITPVEVPTLPGDFNEDGVVDAVDYNVWRGGLGDLYSVTDYEVWKANFGATGLGTTAGGTYVPEPGTWVLVSGVLMGLFCQRLREKTGERKLTGG